MPFILKQTYVTVPVKPGDMITLRKRNADSSLVNYSYTIVAARVANDKLAYGLIDKDFINVAFDNPSHIGTSLVYVDDISQLWSNAVEAYVYVHPNLTAGFKSIGRLLPGVSYYQTTTEGKVDITLTAGDSVTCLNTGASLRIIKDVAGHYGAVNALTHTLEKFCEYYRIENMFKFTEYKKAVADRAGSANDAKPKKGWGLKTSNGVAEIYI